LDVRHIALIDQYAEAHQLELSDVVYQALEEFFQRRGDGEGVKEDARPGSTESGGV
jgi:hypothetical protein